jgi:hypothetical protein
MLNVLGACPVALEAQAWLPVRRQRDGEVLGREEFWMPGLRVGAQRMNSPKVCTDLAAILVGSGGHNKVLNWAQCSYTTDVHCSQFWRMEMMSRGERTMTSSVLPGTLEQAAFLEAVHAEEKEKRTPFQY